MSSAQNNQDQSLGIKLDALLKSYDRQDGPGVVVGVALHGRTIYRRAYGLANVEHGVPMTPGTRVSICSVTKHITCAAVLQLADEGKLLLDDPIERWVPDLQGPTGRATLRQLMNHSGGVRCHLDVAAFNGVTPHPVGIPMQMMRAQTSVNFEPGEGMMYSNGGYVLLSMAVEQASGKPFGRYVEDELFAPRRMDASSSPRTWWPVLPQVATYYMPQPGGGWRHGIGFEEETFGSGSVISSVDDMLRWSQALRESQGAVSLAALTETPPDSDSFIDGVYRYGLTDEVWRGIRVVEHSGGAVGASCHLLLAPGQGLDIFIFFNSIEPAQQVAREIAALVLGERLTAETPAEPFHVQDHQALLGQFVDDHQGLIVGFGDIGGPMSGQLGVSIFGSPAVPFLKRHEPQHGELPFHVPTAVGPRYFRLAPDSRAPEWLDAGHWRALRPIELSEPPLDTLLEGLGGTGFFSAEANATLNFRLHDGELLMHSCGDFGVWKFHPRAIARDMFLFGFYKGAASWLARLRWEGKAVTRIEMSSTRTRGLVFNRGQRT